jgi:Protein of unknown function (DUF3142)
MAVNAVARSMRRTASILACFLMVVPIRSEQFHFRSPDRMSALPPLVLWAWERPEDLRFINPQNTAIAFLAATIRVETDNVAIRPRLQSLLVPDRAKLVAVIRIEADRDAALDRSQIEAAVAVIAKQALLPRVVAIQIDFDATRSQRGFYRALLLDLRRRLGPGVPISITALASWCLDDDWISSLPIDEAVPMLFRMGAGTNDVVGQLTSGRDFRPLICQRSLGVSTDERWMSLPAGRRLYVFQPRPWTEQAELAFLWEVHGWR